MSDFDDKGAPMLRLLRGGAVAIVVVVLSLTLTGCGEPTATFTSPTAGQVVGGTAQPISLNVSDPAGTETKGVQFQVDGQNLGTEDTAAPFARNWNTTALANGNHTLTAVIRYHVTTSTGDSTTSMTIMVDVENHFTVDVGDSINYQAFGQGPLGSAPANLWQVSAPGAQITNLQPIISDMAAKGQIARLIIAAGTNDAGADGWTAEDMDRFRTAMNTVPADVCVEVVLTGYVPGTISADYATQMDAGHAGVLQLVAERPNSVAADWQAVINADLADNGVADNMATDGIHLRSDENGNVLYDARLLRQQTQWDALNGCAA